MENANVSISIILCAHNEECSIINTIESIRRQESIYIYQLIGVDNLSSDNTRGIINDLCDVSLTCMERGKIPSIRKAMKVASGQLVAIIDADTVYPAGWINIIGKELGSQPDCVLLYGPTYSDESSSRNSSVWFEAFRRFSVQCGVCPAVGYNYAFRRDCLEALLLDYCGNALTGWGLATDALRKFGEGRIIYSKYLHAPKCMRRIREKSHAESLKLWVSEWMRLSMGAQLKIKESDYYGFRPNSKCG